MRGYLEIMRRVLSFAHAHPAPMTRGTEHADDEAVRWRAERLRRRSARHEVLRRLRRRFETPYLLRYPRRAGQESGPGEPRKQSCGSHRRVNADSRCGRAVASPARALWCVQGGACVLSQRMWPAVAGAGEPASESAGSTSCSFRADALRPINGAVPRASWPQGPRCARPATRPLVGTWPRRRHDRLVR